jgi:hypothetical protein
MSSGLHRNGKGDLRKIGQAFGSAIIADEAIAHRNSSEKTMGVRPAICG